MAKREEQMTRRLYPTTPAPEYQFSYDFKDSNIILDVSRLLAVALENGSGFSISDREKIDGFIKSFIPLFFGINSRDVEDTVNSISRKTPDDEGDFESVNHRGGRKPDTNDLLRDVLKRGKGKNTRKDKDESVISRANSRDSSLEPHDGDVEMTSPYSSDRPVKEEGNWIARPTKHLPGVKPNFPMSPAEHDDRQFQKRTVFTLYCNTTIYGFFRAFQILYDRLAAVKATEDQIRADVERRKTVKVAHEINIMTHRVEDVFLDTSPTANYYSQILDMCEKVLEGELDTAGFEESLRNVNVQQGWKLFTIEKTCNSILKFIQCIVPSDGKEKNTEKEKTADIVLRFQKDREHRGYEKEGSEYRELIAYRRAVEGILGQTEDVYRIDWHEIEQKATIRLVPRGSPTVTSELDKDESWQYYISTYMMCSPTEGIPLDRCSKVFLRRGYPQEKDIHTDPSKSTIRENMEVRICVNTYRLFFMPGTEDLVVKDPKCWAPVPLGTRERRKNLWKKKLGTLSWMKDTKPEEVDEKQKEWESFLRGDNTSENRGSVEVEDLEDPKGATGGGEVEMGGM